MSKQEHIDGYMSDAQGRLVPIDQVRPVDMARNDLVREIVKDARALSRQLAAFRRRVKEDITAFVELSTERYGAKLGGAKGNVQVMSYDGAYRVMLAVHEAVEFDEGLHAAKSLIDDCLRRWSAGANGNLRVVVNDAFKVDKKGHLDVKRILSLRRLEINDAQWKRAMDAISEAVHVTDSRRYIRIYERDGAGEYRHMPLDLANAESPLD